VREATVDDRLFLTRCFFFLDRFRGRGTESVGMTMGATMRRLCACIDGIVYDGTY